MSLARPAATICVSSLCLHSAIKEMPRRSFLYAAGAVGLGVALAPLTALGQDRPPACPINGKPYDAMVLSCIDPRIIDQVHFYMTTINNQRCRYSEFTIAGAAVAVIAPRFKAWRQTFWDNLDTTIKMHEIKKVIAIDHRQCGAAKLAYGEQTIADPVKERETHQRVLKDFKQQVHSRYPGRLEVVTGLMELDGKIEIFT